MKSPKNEADLKVIDMCMKRQIARSIKTGTPITSFEEFIPLPMPFAILVVQSTIATPSPISQKSLRKDMQLNQYLLRVFQLAGGQIVF